MGKTYDDAKKDNHSRPGNTSAEKRDDQNDHRESEGSTAEKIASEYGVGSATVKRNGTYAEAVDKLADTLGHEFRRAILSRDSKLGNEDMINLASE